MGIEQISPRSYAQTPLNCEGVFDHAPQQGLNRTGGMHFKSPRFHLRCEGAVDHALQPGPH